MSTTYETLQQYFNAIFKGENPRQKPVVHYRKERLSPAIPVKGRSAVVVPVDHPAQYLNGITITTSTVLAVFEDGFETHNTRYVLVD